jgi:hypothetical protein
LLSVTACRQSSLARRNLRSISMPIVSPLAALE